MDAPLGMVLGLDKALDGSKQAGNLWFKFLLSVLRRWVVSRLILLIPYCLEFAL